MVFPAFLVQQKYGKDWFDLRKNNWPVYNGTANVFEVCFLCVFK